MSSSRCLVLYLYNCFTHYRGQRRHHEILDGVQRYELMASNILLIFPFFQNQRTLQLRIEAQGKKLQKMFEEQLKASRTVAEQPEELHASFASVVRLEDDGGKASVGYDKTGSKTGPRAGLLNRHRSAL